MSIKEKLTAGLHKTETIAAFLAVFFLALIPTMEVVARKFFETGVAGATPYTKHLVLILTFIAGMITAREKKHLSLSLNLDIKEPLKSWLATGNAVLSSMMTFAFAMSALSFSLRSFDRTRKVGAFPIWIVSLIMCLGFIVMAVRFVKSAPDGDSEHKNKYRRIAWLGLPLGLFLSFEPLVNILSTFVNEVPEGLWSLQESVQSVNASIALPLILLLIASAAFGARIFVVLGGIGYLLFVMSGEPVEVIPNEAYELLTSHAIPAIPLFTVTGFILSEGKAGERLVRFFKAMFGWIRGGLSIMAILVCAFFTTFTGASGVTILALGGLLVFVLKQGKYQRKFRIGLLTASGSIGLLFPPSLPIIIYGVTAGVSIKDMFIGGIVPGFVMVLVLVLYGIYYASKTQVEREPFSFKELLVSLREAIWEVLLPVVVVVGFFGGLTTLVESSAIAVLYVIITQVFIHKDLKIRELPNVVSKSIPIIGGVLIILALAKGLSYYMVDAEIPTGLAAWMKANISSKYVFLFLLNIGLLITGCIMDIFSAILVVVPLIIPLGEIFGIHPVHLGIIFLANMELGYLTPPVGLNLFLASYRFEEPMTKIYRDVLPFFLIQLVSVLLITYIPFLSTALL
jgi:tripartite ATP-independent transporter DctM subunit